MIVRPDGKEDDTKADSDLVRQFSQCHDEKAFAELVRRHGPLVMGVCQQVLRHSQDAEDAFQATFVVLASRSRSIKQAESLGSWLYKVAYRTAMRSARIRQRNRCENLPDVCVVDDPLRSIYEQSLQFAVHEELSRLPEAYRCPVVLCYLEGKTRQQAADELGCTDASIKARLARARQMLRVRLARRGMTLSVALAATCSGIAIVRDSFARELLGKTVSLALSNASTVTGGYQLAESVHFFNTVRTYMSFPIKTKLASVAAAFAIMILGLSCMGTIAMRKAPAQSTDVQIGETYFEPQIHRADSVPLQFVAHDVRAEPGHSSDSDADTGELEQEKEYLEKKAQAYFVLRDVELERANSAPDALSRKEARAKAQLHEAEADRLSQQAKQLQTRLARSDSIEVTLESNTASRYFVGPAFATMSDVLPPAPCCRDNNLAYGRSVTASSQEEIINNFAQLAVDGDLSTRWCAEDSSTGEWIQVDLGAVKKVSQIRIHWEMMNTRYSYRIETSSDGTNWRRAIDTSKGPARDHMPDHDLNAAEARFIRITFLGSDTGFWGSIREIEVSDGELSPPPIEAWEMVRPDADQPALTEFFELGV